MVEAAARRRLRPVRSHPAIRVGITAVLALLSVLSVSCGSSSGTSALESSTTSTSSSVSSPSAPSKESIEAMIETLTKAGFNRTQARCVVEHMGELSTGIGSTDNLSPGDRTKVEQLMKGCGLS